MKLSKAYQPADHESEIYRLWEDSGAFAPSESGEPFTIIMPPPNANADLHAGHALFMAVQDVVTRFQRMNGKAALWVPGADHAGFETWVVYEKHLAKEGKTRFDFSREQLYAQVWDFVELNKTKFKEQFRALGASCDWSRFTYTLDEKVVKVAYRSFKQMWDDGLIYRGERIVNFCTFHGTSFSDYEVIYKTAKSHLYYINFPLTDGSGHVTVATTRPETMVGDVAVAVHPDDARYKAFVGKTIALPLTKREIPIIADEMVDTSFGSGAVKITPAHDINDFEVVKRHDLPTLSVIGHDGLMNHNAPEAYQGLTVEDARAKVLQDLEALGVLEKTEDYTNNVGHCYKCDTIIQPLLKDQWFVSMKPLAKEAIAALEADKIAFHPASKKKAVIEYLHGIRDWNISRQIAWGIPIPAFQSADDPEKWIYDDRVTEESIEVDGHIYHRDPDVFDTWFSSGQWPYTTLGYPDSEDFKRFFPTSLMETGGEILFVWVARMIMMSLYVTGEIPFKDVYIHGNVKASDGTKMSKSKGNTINPMELIEEYGSDALRIGTLSGRTAGSHQSYTPAKLVGGRNFANKLWNIARFIQETVGEDYKFTTEFSTQSIQDAWIVNRIDDAAKTVADYLETYQFALALERVHDLVWNEFADWYIEASKSAPNKQLLAVALEAILKLAHPFAPFVTEAIWQNLNWETGSMIITRAWPSLERADQAQADAFAEIQALVTELRTLATNIGIHKPAASYTTTPVIDENSALICSLAKLSSLTAANEGSGLELTQTKHKVWLTVTDEQKQAYIDKLTSDSTQLTQLINQLESRLGNANYVANAPEEIVSESQAELTEAKRQYEATIAALKKLA